jgi:hypothetical protein
VPIFSSIAGGGTAADTVAGGSSDKARSVIFSRAPDWIRASLLLARKKEMFLLGSSGCLYCL